MKLNRMKSTDTKVPVLFFEEGDKVIAYSPAFDLSTCGDTEEKARHRFAEAVAIFLGEITRTGTLSDVLEERGWHKVSKGQEWRPPVYRTCTEESINIPVRG